MKILVDELPSSCEKCMFCSDTEGYINDYKDDCIKCKCRLLRTWNKDGLWSIDEYCPLTCISDELSIEINRYTKWEDIMLKVSVNLGENEICHSETRIGDSGWSDY
jgi:hypothetical protein